MQNGEGKQGLRVFTFQDVYGAGFQVWRQAAQVVLDRGADGVAVRTDEVAEVVGSDNSNAVHRRLFEAEDVGVIYKAGMDGKVALWLPVGVKLKDPMQSTWGKIRDCITRYDEGEGVTGYAVADDIGYSRSNVQQVLERYLSRKLLKRVKRGRAWKWSLTAKGKKTPLAD